MKSSNTASNGVNFALRFTENLWSKSKIVHFDAPTELFLALFSREIHLPGYKSIGDEFGSVNTLDLRNFGLNFIWNLMFSRNNSIILTHQRSCFWLYFHGKFIFQDVNRLVMSLGRPSTLLISRNFGLNSIWNLMFCVLIFRQLKNLTIFGSVALFTFSITDRILVQITRSF